MEEIERRSKILEEAGVKILREYNHSLAEASSSGIPYIVIAISNLAELMPISDKNKKIETAIAYIADKGGAVGIHLVIRSSSTDRNIITGLIHANFRTCISFRLRSKKESRSALYCSGAEKLGRPGDMLFQDIRNTRRIQGACFLE
jgi:S-DNA-T family DNA segregation ATPase FtsK/SpoIIIE